MIETMAVGSDNALPGSTDHRFRKKLIVLAAVTVAITLGIVVFYFMYVGVPPASVACADTSTGNWAGWGTLGDFFGGTLNPVLGLLGFLALLYTIHVQQRELKLATEQVMRSDTALQEQKESVQEQNFQQAFFLTLQLHVAAVRDMETHRSAEATPARGHACFRLIYERFIEKYRDTPDMRPEDSDAQVQTGKHRETKDLAAARKAYETCYQEFQFELSYYFERIAAMLFVLGYCPEGALNRYQTILRAHLSTYEMLLLFYHALWNEHSGLKAVIERHHLMQTVDCMKLAFKREIYHACLYEESAYGTRVLPYHIEKDCGWH
jgi:hypothetical protein